MQNVILFVGGGSLGHVLPSLAVYEEMKRKDSSVHAVFITANREEEIQALKLSSIDVRPLDAPKFPRGFSLSIILFPLQFFVAMVRSWRILSAVQPSLIFSKGGYISVPFCMTAFLRRIPVVLHMSDSVPSVSDSVVGRFARTIYTGFPSDTLSPSFQVKAIQTGNPVRAIFAQASRSTGMRITGFSGRRPVVMITGGSQGAQSINDEVERIFDQLIDTADVIHLTGSGKGIARTHARYYARPLVYEELPHLLALADVVVTRAGASALSEMATLQKPTIVIPLEGVGHDHQVSNAHFLSVGGAIDLLPQAELSSLLVRIRRLLDDEERRRVLGAQLNVMLPASSSETIASITLDVLHRKPLHS